MYSVKPEILGLHLILYLYLNLFENRGRLPKVLTANDANVDVFVFVHVFVEVQNSS